MAERFEVRRLLPAVWAGSLLIVVLASLWPEGTRLDAATELVWWNVGHVPAYAVLTMLTLMVAAQRFPATAGRLLWLAAGLALLGILIEVLQPYFGRTADVVDAVYNVIGILLALGVFYASRRWQGVRRRVD